MESQFRKPNDSELQLLKRLLAEEFAGALELRSQLEDILVRSLDSDGCLELQVINRISSPVTGIPVEASYSNQLKSDPFGPKTHVLLHVDENGLLTELEFYNDDCRFPIEPPIVDDLEIEIRNPTFR